jgi:glycosyltransferase involved in cell wall biosynthesis
MSETLETVDLNNTPCPAVSIIIPLYNAANQIAECLDSLLAQTFQDFEVIVVDDCSTDNSTEIVKGYEEKFDGRLTLTKTEKNSGGGGYVPRNLGLSLANGEYVFFLDADDFILLIALETLYNVAKEYDADVVYTGYFYNLVSSNSIYLRQDGESKKLLREGLEDKIDLRIDDQKGNLSKLLLEEREGHFRNPWSRFVKRELLIENKIIFPARMTTGGDFIWVISLYCHAKKFLRIPTPIYFYRNYNAESVTQTKRIPSEQLAHWISAFVDFAKNLGELENQNAILSENPVYCLQTLKSHFDWCLSRTNDARKELSNQDIYEILYREFAKDSSGAAASLLPFFFSFIDTEIKVGDERLQTINQLEKNVADLKKSFAHPAISVIVPMYNVEEYIAECLDSILLQTFQDFEVIVVDDCSTDNSVKIVESYIPKFDGRLKLFHMEKNTGSGALPRNRGLSISNGEYIYLTDADDFILLNTLEILYTSAKKYDADVVYTGSYYKMKATNDVYVYRDGEGHKLLRDGLEDKPNLYVNDQVGNLNRLLLQEKEGNFRGPTTKFIKRKLLIDNKIYFPKIPIGEDFIWVINVYCHAKRFLRISTPFYFYRLNTASVTKTKRTPSEQLNHWISAFVDFTKSLRELESENEVLSKNPVYCLSALQGHFEWCFYFINEARKELSNQEIYESLHREFAKDSSGSIVPFFFSFIDSEKRVGSERLQTIQNLQKIISQPKNLSDFLLFRLSFPCTMPKNISLNVLTVS